MDSAAAAVRSFAEERPLAVPIPAAVLQEAWSRTPTKEGRSTACLVVLEARAQRALLHAANLGDSGFYVLRMLSQGSRARMSFAHRFAMPEQKKIGPQAHTSLPRAFLPHFLPGAERQHAGSWRVCECAVGIIARTRRRGISGLTCGALTDHAHSSTHSTAPINWGC